MKLFMGLFLIFVLASLVLFDIALNRQYRYHIEQWRKDGCPWGFFSFPREVGFIAGCKARNGVFRQWLLGKPAWLASDPVAMNCVYLFRITSAMACLSWAFVVMIMIKTA